MLKQRVESIDIYKKNIRQDLLEVEQKEYEILSSFLPKQFSEVPYLYPEYITDEPIGDQDVTLDVSELNLLSS